MGKHTKEERVKWRADYMEKLEREMDAFDAQTELDNEAAMWKRQEELDTIAAKIREEKAARGEDNEDDFEVEITDELLNNLDE